MFRCSFGFHSPNDCVDKHLSMYSFVRHRWRRALAVPAWGSELRCQHHVKSWGWPHIRFCNLHAGGAGETEQSLGFSASFAPGSVRGPTPEKRVESYRAGHFTFSSGFRICVWVPMPTKGCTPHICIPYSFICMCILFLCCPPHTMDTHTCMHTHLGVCFGLGCKSFKCIMNASTISEVSLSFFPSSRPPFFLSEGVL